VLTPGSVVVWEDISVLEWTGAFTEDEVYRMCRLVRAKCLEVCYANPISDTQDSKTENRQMPYSWLDTTPLRLMLLTKTGYFAISCKCARTTSTYAPCEVVGAVL
jgi:hypothetical protein